jgi:hypothetical protein
LTISTEPSSPQLVGFSLLPFFVSLFTTLQPSPDPLVMGVLMPSNTSTVLKDSSCANRTTQITLVSPGLSTLWKPFTKTTDLIYRVLISGNSLLSERSPLLEALYSNLNGVVLI